MYPKTIHENYENLTKYLIKNQFSIATMESATGGLIASLITDTEGSSAIFKGSFVTYSNEAKIKQGVSAEIIETFSVYSKETASAMAQACRKAYNTSIGIGVTGTMGNIDPENPEASAPGQVYFAIDYNGNVTSYQVKIAPQKSRLEYKLAVAEELFQRMCLLLPFDNL